MLTTIFFFLVTFARGDSLSEPEATVQPVETASPEKDLASHLTTNARTGPPGTVSLQRSPGANLNTDFLLTVLSVVVSDRIEIGTSPAYYFEKESRGNIFAKYNFWRGKEFVWAGSAHYSNFQAKQTVTINGTSTPFEFILHLTAFQLAVNYLPTDSRFSFGAAISTYFTELDLTIGPSNYGDVEDQSEIGVDVSYALNKRLDITFGTGYMRETGLTAYERSFFGFGSSLRWKRDSSFFSTITIGAHYTPKTEDTLFLFSTKLFTYD